MNNSRWLHTGIAAAMVLIYTVLPVAISIPIAVLVHWYCWELSQRIAKDALQQGITYWWDMRRWGNTARQEAIYPMVTSVLTGIVIYLAQVFCS